MQPIRIIDSDGMGPHSGADPILISCDACLDEAKPHLSIPSSRTSQFLLAGNNGDPAGSALPNVVEINLTFYCT
jgi:hypothetical protein